MGGKIFLGLNLFVWERPTCYVVDIGVYWQDALFDVTPKTITTFDLAIKKYIFTVIILIDRETVMKGLRQIYGNVHRCIYDPVKYEAVNYACHR